jgi:hypothetical protein
LRAKSAESIERFLLRGCFCLFLAAAFCVTTRADDHVGWIDSIHCHAQLRKDPSSAPIDLDPARDQGMLLYPGQAVRCKAPAKDGDQIAIQDHADLLTKSSKDGWYELKGKSFAANEDDKAIAAFGRTAGRPRGAPGGIYSPAEGSTVRAKDFTIGWTPAVLGASPQFVIKNALGREIWSGAPDAAASSNSPADGILESAPLRETLAKLQDDTRSPQLILETQTSAGVPLRIHFSLISRDDEKQVVDDVEQSDAKPGLLRYARREYAFTSHELWNDAAKEFDRAAGAFPRSRELLSADLAIHEQIGDTARASALRSQLASLNTPSMK